MKIEFFILSILFVTARTSSKNRNKDKVTVLHPDKIGRRQRGATEACFLHVAGKRRGSRLPRLPGGEQLLLFTLNACSHSLSKKGNRVRVVSHRQDVAGFDVRE
ncbi:MAG: hypothetical protein OXB88_05425 [Bacteriovoracales bacterium]|nr:hypothetical protein [Bacteriovoracales bacterium]